MECQQEQVKSICTKKLPPLQCAHWVAMNNASARNCTTYWLHVLTTLLKTKIDFYLQT